MDPQISPLDSALFKIKMDIMLIKSEILQLKDELTDYLVNIVNLHLSQLKSKIENRSKMNEADCELGLQKDGVEEEEEDYFDGDCSEKDSDENSEEFTDEE